MVIEENADGSVTLYLDFTRGVVRLTVKEANQLRAALSGPAVLAEREECAKTALNCDEPPDDGSMEAMYPPYRKIIAEAIRARNNNQPENKSA